MLSMLFSIVRPLNGADIRIYVSMSQQGNINSIVCIQAFYKGAEHGPCFISTS